MDALNYNDFMSKNHILNELYNNIWLKCVYIDIKCKDVMKSFGREVHG